MSEVVGRFVSDIREVAGWAFGLMFVFGPMALGLAQMYDGFYRGDVGMSVAGLALILGWLAVIFLAPRTMDGDTDA